VPRFRVFGTNAIVPMKAAERGSRMARRCPIALALAAALVAPVLQGAAPVLGVPVGDDVYVNCEYRVAAQFPSEPMFRDLTYSVGTRSAPARQFYVERGKSRLSVTVARFADGPAIDAALLDDAAAALRQRGQVRFESAVYYDEPVIPGRQFNIALADGRVLRAAVYMADHRLYITEAAADLNDGVAFRFEQSVSLIDANGTDLDTNPVVATTTIGTSAGLPSRQYDCGRLKRRAANPGR
jgi:hypothetical protein